MLAHKEDGSSYEAPFWDDIRVDATATKINPATSKPDFDAFPAGATYTKTLLFDGGARETITFAVQVPHGWRIGTELHPHVHWAATTVELGKTVTWDLNYVLADVNGLFGAEVTRTGTTTGDTAVDAHRVTGLQAIDMSAITGVSPMLMCALSRRGDTDTYTADVALLEFDIHYQLDAPGSRQEYVK